MLGMLFATSEINKNPNLLPNMTLGLKVFDSCMWETRALEGIIDLLTGGEEPVPNFICQSSPTLLGVIGGLTSSASMTMAHILKPYRFPQISYASQHSKLSDKNLFPSFLRTVPSQSPQSLVFAQLVKHFNWTWIGLLASDSDVCYMMIKGVKEEAERLGICVSFWEKLSDSYSKERLRAIAETIRRSSAQVIICDCYSNDLNALLHHLSYMKQTDKIWILSTGFTISATYFPAQSWRLLNGSLVLVLHTPEIYGFKNFLESLHPLKDSEDIFIKTFWEVAFDCRWPVNDSSLIAVLEEAGDDKLRCTGVELVEDVNSMFVLYDMGLTYHIYLAVYALARALQDLISCTPGRGPFQNSSCAELSHLKLWQMLPYVRSVRFNTSGGEEIFFDENGDVPAVFDFVNLQIFSDGTDRLVQVGTFDSNAHDGEQMKLKMDEMMWSTGHIQVPSSFCSESCPPGFRQSVRKGQPSCCFDCVPCPAGEISNMTDF
ncbi:extracellular calcium-sensing receptor-like [Lissotriton helveticus]